MAVGNIRTVDYLVNTSFAANVNGDIGNDDSQDAAESLGGLPFSASNPIAGTTFTPALVDRGTVMEFSNNGSAVNVIIPLDASMAIPFPVGTVLIFTQMGTSQVTLGGTTSLLSPGGSLTTRVQYSTISARKRTTNQWVVSGDLA